MYTLFYLTISKYIILHTYYDCLGIKMNIIQAELHWFLSSGFERKENMFTVS